jgi:DNA-directed RNA polymerase specialized sigma24 family protein
MAEGDMGEDGSVTRWLRSLEQGDHEAVAPLWSRYFQNLAGIARQQMGSAKTGAADENDVALSAFHSFCQRLKAGGFRDLQGRDDLWRVLVVIVKRKAISWLRHETAEKRGGGKRYGEAFLDDVVSDEPTPEFTAELMDELRRLLAILRREDGTLCLIAMRKLEGYNTSEIAAELSVSPRTVERKFRRVCILWAEDVDKRAEDD